MYQLSLNSTIIQFVIIILLGQISRGLQSLATVSVYYLFGNRWLNLHSGPIWKVIGMEQGGSTSLSSSRRIEDVRINLL